MKNIRLFEEASQYEAVKDSFEYPTVSYTKDNGLVWYMEKPSLYEWVDLGLPSGLKWSAWNVGATKPEEYGLYFAWGETQGYSGITDEKGFYWGDYKYTKDACTGSTDTTFRGGLTKYNSKSASGVVDNLTTLELVDDAAYATDNTCRMPTSGECQELIDNTTSAWTQVNGVSGVSLTSKVNENSIFVPAAGYCGNGSVLNVGQSGLLWSSSLNESNPKGAFSLGFDSSYMDVYDYYRFYGFSLRLVKE